MEKKLNLPIKFDISSTAIEKSIDAARDFLSQLIGPAVNETGLLMKDKIVMWRFERQVKMLTKAREICLKNNISPKKVPLKLVVPLLEHASLEDDDFLLDKWSTLISNLVDSEQNITNHVFPHLLSQISKNEYLVVEELFLKNQMQVIEYRCKLSELLIIQENQNIEKLKKDQLSAEISRLDYNDPQRKILQDQVYKIQTKVSKVETEIWRIGYKIKADIVFPEGLLKAFEVSNLIRLGILKEIHSTTAEPQTVEIPGNDSYSEVKFEPEVDLETEIIITELGKLFLQACQEKSTIPKI